MPDTVTHDLSPGALTAAIEESEIQYTLYRARVAGWEVYEDSGLTWYYSGDQDAYHNGVLRTTLTSDEADARIADMLARFDTRGVPMVWWSGPSRRPTDLGARLIAHGFTSQGDDPGMAADLHALRDDLPLPADFAAERVRDHETARLWLRTARIANGNDPDVSRVPLTRFAPATYDDSDPLHLYLATLNAAPVATAQVFLAAGVAGLYFISTIPSARCRGIGTGVTLAALRDARAAGYRIGVLGASQLGVGVYQRLGFREYCKLTLYTRDY